MCGLGVQSYAYHINNKIAYLAMTASALVSRQKGK